MLKLHVTLALSFVCLFFFSVHALHHLHAIDAERFLFLNSMFNSLLSHFNFKSECGM